MQIYGNAVGEVGKLSVYGDFAFAQNGGSPAALVIDVTKANLVAGTD